MNAYTKILVTTLPLVFFFLAAAVGTTYHFSHSALTDLAETWLETRLSEAMEVAAGQNDMLYNYGLEDIPASTLKAKLDAGTMMGAIKIKSEGYIFAVDRHGTIVVRDDAAPELDARGLPRVGLDLGRFLQHLLAQWESGREGPQPGNPR